MVASRVSLRKRSRSRLPVKRIREADGTVRVLTIVDAESKTFGEDLLEAFSRNVRKARRENRRRFGVPDFVPKG